MSDKLSVVILARNELEMTKLCIQSVRLFLGVEESEIIIIDNHSEDGTYEWACEQSDVSTVLFDDEVKTWGYALNTVIKEFDIVGHLLILPAWCALTEGCASGMLKLVDEYPVIGCSCNRTNNVYFHPSRSIESYRDAIEYAQEIKTDERIEIAMGLSPTPVLFRKGAIDQIGPFSEDIYSLSKLYIDYGLKMLEKKIKIGVKKSSFAFAMSEEVVMEDRFMEDAEYLREIYDTHYFNMSPNAYISNLILEDAKEMNKEGIKVLEIGCDMGATLFDIKQRACDAVVYGCELNPAAAKIAENFAEVYVGNIEEHDLPFSRDYFDYIIFGDVLEHLRNPMDVLTYVRDFLNAGGKIVASIPNLMNITVMKELLKGNFTYTEIGLLDRTHIHLFTYNEICRMFTQAGYICTKIAHTTNKIGEKEEELIGKLLEIEPSAEYFMYRAFQYLVLAAKDNG